MTTPTTCPVTLADDLPVLAARFPTKPAVVVQGPARLGKHTYRQQTFAELEAATATFAAGFHRLGVRAGMRVVLMVRPGLEFLPLLFALWRIGAVPVLVDPGMGRLRLLHCLASTRPEAFVGIPLAHVLRLFAAGYFRSVKLAFTIGRRLCWGGYDLADLRQPAPAPPPSVATPADLAAIIFTTGSTGPPKGVEYTHGMFTAQRALLAQTFGLTPADVDLAGFALFALFTVSLGMTVVLPAMDPTRPAKVTPAHILAAVHDHQCTFSFGSPALWRRVALNAAVQRAGLPSLRQVTMAGAPVPPTLHRLMLERVLGPQAQVYTPYGATECLPVTCFTGREVLAETDPLTRRGRGTCVGKALPGIQLRVIKTTDAPIHQWASVELLPAGQIGEVVVQGPVVSRQYYALPEQTERHKIYESDDHGGAFWHRLGDLGYLDEQGRLWFCGRQSHRVIAAHGELYTVCCEAIFNEHPRVARSALVGIGDNRYQQRPVVVIEPLPGEFPLRRTPRIAFERELCGLAAGNPLTAGLETFLFMEALPVDIRHNAKIFREQLAEWAAFRLRDELNSRTG